MERLGKNVSTRNLILFLITVILICFASLRALADAYSLVRICSDGQTPNDKIINLLSSMVIEKDKGKASLSLVNDLGEELLIQGVISETGSMIEFKNASRRNRLSLTVHKIEQSYVGVTAGPYSDIGPCRPGHVDYYLFTPKSQTTSNR